MVTDTVSDSCDLEGRNTSPWSSFPASSTSAPRSAIDCVRLIDPSARVNIRSANLLLFDNGVTDEELARIRHYYINAVESREKDLSRLTDLEHAEVKPCRSSKASARWARRSWSPTASATAWR